MPDEDYMCIILLLKKKFNQFQMLFPPPIANFANTFVDSTIFAEGLAFQRERSGIWRPVIAQSFATNQISLRVPDVFKRTFSNIVNHRLSSFTMDRGLAAQFVAPVPGLCK